MKGQLRAIAQVQRGGLLVHDRAKLLGFSEFEQYAGSSARRASTYMFTITGESVQVRVLATSHGLHDSLAVVYVLLNVAASDLS